MTRVQVSHSSIRPNDRGKEVLSFVIIVDPGSGKEPWKIEKLYSDFISLDQKIRSTNRGLTKKMPSLPDNKLWRDHAPAKVDQRKASRRIREIALNSCLLIREGRTGELPSDHSFASAQRPK
jgi:RalA-binding protein 1